MTDTTHEALALEPGISLRMACRILAELGTLPTAFTRRDADGHLNDRQLRALLAIGALTKPQRGLYAKADSSGDDDLIEIAALRPRATLCLRSALARHDLIDDIPAEIDIALPRGSRAPQTDAPAAWHHFDADTFDIGRDELELDDGAAIGLYSPERSIIDAFRLRHLEGSEIANEALRNWLRRRGQPSILMHMARDFPAARRPLQNALEILL